MPQIDVKQIDHLGIVAGFCDQDDLVQLIDEQVGKDNRTVSVGTAVKARKSERSGVHRLGAVSDTGVLS